MYKLLNMIDIAVLNNISIKQICKELGVYHASVYHSRNKLLYDFKYMDETNKITDSGKLALEYNINLFNKVSKHGA